MNKLTPEEQKVILQKSTEHPFTGEYDNFYKPGTYICRQCNSPLFSSKAKFDAACGWPAFDENFPNSVKRTVDHGMYGIEIDCTNCNGHLGHVYEGEKFTEKDTRHCVNSLSMKFVPEGENLPEVHKA
jgi:peptide-methionine (R)-S-oxide reductase